MTGLIPSSRRSWLTSLALLFTFALLIRVYYLGVAEPGNVVRGDSVDYVTYAGNLLRDGTFSRERRPAPTPDAYRGPGYPALVATTMVLAGPERWPSALRGTQAIVGAAACALVALLVAPWAGRRWGIAAGSLLALWPHHIAATMDILVEVSFGTLLLAWLVVAAHAWRSRSLRWSLAAGGVLGLAALTNPVALALAPASIPWAWRAGRTAVGLGILAGTLLTLAPWQLRSITLAESQAESGRALINLVQGSWPSYHAAYRSRNAHPEPRAIIAAIDAEVALMRTDPGAGLAAIRARMSEQPGRYLAWYLAEKPFLLWGWHIRIGAGDVYTFPVEHSPLERHPVLAATKRALSMANPLLTLIVLTSAVLLGARGLKSPREVPPEAVLLAISVIILTSVHVLLQAEPRYATAYRGLEAGLLAGAFAAILRRLRPTTIDPEALIPRGASDSSSARDGVDQAPPSISGDVKRQY